MAIGFHGAFITIDSTWLPFKAQVISKSLSIQYYDDGDRYVIFALDDNVILYLTFIYKNTVPDTIVLAGYSQSQNDSDKSDFVSNFLPFSNTTVGGIFTDKSSFTYGTSTAAPAGGVYQDTSPALTAGQIGAVRLTANRAFQVNLRSADGYEKIGQLTMANSIPITIASDQSSFTVGATQSGTWTVQPGNTANTTPWLVTDSSDGTVAAGTAAAKSSLIGIVYNTALPALTNGQQAAAQADSSGRILIGSIASALPTGSNVIGAVTQSAGPWTQNITQFGSSAVATGTGASGSGIPRVTVANDSNILATQSGTWTVAQGTAASLSGKWPVLMTDGTNSMPTLDTVGRAGYVRITDGTNTLGTLFNTFHADPNGDRRTIHSNATITSSGSTVVTWNGHSEWYLIINIKNAPTGTTPTITFSIDQLDPIDQTTVLTGIGDVKSDITTALNSVGVTILEITELVSDTVKISWVVTGGSPSFTGVNVTWCGHGPGNAIEGQAEEGTELHDGPLPIAGVDSSRIVRACKVDSAGNLLVNNASAGGSNGIAYGTITTGATTNVAIRATTYTEQASNAQRSISSASANDTSAGTGARTVKVTYYNSTGAGPSTETITLNGTTAVNTVSATICYIEKIEVLTVGSGGSNAGIITLFAATAAGGGAVGTIAVGDNRTFWAHHYVPTGQTCNITGMTGNNNNSSNQTLFSIRSKNLSVANSAENQVSDTLVNGGGTAQAERTFGAPLQVLGPARVTMFAQPGGSPTIINRGSFDFYDQ